MTDHITLRRAVVQRLLDALYSDHTDIQLNAAIDLRSILFRAMLSEPNHDNPCRSDGGCQYAIDHGAEGMGHCPKGKCALAEPVQEPVHTDSQTGGIQSGTLESDCRWRMEPDLYNAARAKPVQEPVPRLITTEPWGWLKPPYGEVQRNLAVKATWASTAAVNPPYPLYLGHPEASHDRQL